MKAVGHHLFRRFGHNFFAIAVLASALSSASAQPVAVPARMAIVDFNLFDTSGEVRDQRAEHQTRLDAMVNRLRSDLVQSRKFQTIDLVCQDTPCKAETMASDRLNEQAQRAGADLILLGAVRKISTLILHLEARVVDVRTGAAVFDRQLSFRGDNDEAWQRAAAFLARDLATQPLSR